ncbi:hypothetical protein M422DRAFT_248769 [Sphaerobolus stellatus SS14]|nr:hypothetical protein M422DRAFT_248769 [Sphaerobolus stellatus SS14]
MVDPLSITASIAGLIQFTTPIITYVRGVAISSDKRTALEEIKRECSVLDRTLKELKVLVDEYNASASGDLNNSVDFSFLMQCLEEYKGPLQSFVKKLKTPSVSSRVGLSNRMKWPLQKQQMEMFLTSVERCKRSITTILSVKQYQVLTALKIEKEENLRRQVIHWLSPLDMNTLEEIQVRHHEDTDGWFLQGDIFKEFQDQSAKHIWLYGIPDCGKPVLVSSVISELRKTYQSFRDIGLTFFIISFRDSQPQTLLDILKSIIAQLCEKLERIPPAIGAIYRNNLLGPSRSCLLKILRILTGIFKKTYVVFDALGEILEKKRSALTKTVKELITGFPGLKDLIRPILRASKEAYKPDQWQQEYYSRLLYLQSLLEFASNIGVFEMVKFLLDNGALDRKASGYKTLQNCSYCPALRLAAIAEHRKRNIIQLLVDTGSDLNCVNLDGTVLMGVIPKLWRSETAAGIEFLQFLIGLGAQIDPVYSRQDGKRYSMAGRLMVRAAWSAKPEVVKFLLDQGASCTTPIQDPHFVTSIHCSKPRLEWKKRPLLYFHINVVVAAMMNNHQASDEILTLLINANVDINAANCIIGWQAGNELDIDYCTALEYLEEFALILESPYYDIYDPKAGSRYRKQAKKLERAGGKRLQ